MILKLQIHMLVIDNEEQQEGVFTFEKTYNKMAKYCVMKVDWLP